jgi:leucyl-tRNA synthetase
VNPDAGYSKVEYKGQRLVMAKAAAQVLKLQMGHEILEDVPVEDILSMEPVNPATGRQVPVLKASFVNPEMGTGIVMSVPAHAPLDYLALRDLGKGDMEMPQVIELKGYGKAPAKDAVERLAVKDQQDPMAEKATKEIYTKEAHEGKMVVSRYQGMPVSEAKVKVAEDLMAQDDAFQIVTIANGPVYCRCGGHAVVNIIQDQWFIDYGIQQWKDKAKQCLEAMTVIPESSRSEFLYTIDWLKTRPCTRASGLGTRFPYDETKMIEALSDSTLYMAYYTIAHMLEGFEPEALDDAFFDYVFLGKGEGDERLKQLRESFLYWYPVDSRHSAGDLVRNHLTLYLFNHVAFLEKELWPRQIVTNGFVLMDGSKMSKSMGNILPLRKAIKEYGADVVRFAVISGADLASDTDFNKSVADGVRSRLISITRLMEKAKEAGPMPHGRIEKWLLSRLNRKIERAEELYEKLSIRHLGLEIFYDVASDLQWYMKRSQEPNLHDFFKTWTVLIAPFMPHYAEEFWEMLGGEGLVSFARFPQADHSKVDDASEQGEEIVKKVHGDIEKISELIGKKPAKVTIFVAGQWKRKLFSIAKEQKKFDLIMKAAGAEGMPMKEAQNVIKQIIRNVHALPDVLPAQEELSTLKDAEGFLSSEYGCEVAVLSEEGAEHPKAKAALPGKPAIVLE